MGKNDNLKDFLTDVADAIREKKGTSEPINPQDFSSEISSIETGGGGGGTKEYWSIPTEVDKTTIILASQCSSIMKCLRGDSLQIMPSASLIAGVDEITILAICIDTSINANLMGQTYTMSELLENLGNPTAALTQITEEEFYSIN